MSTLVERLEEGQRARTEMQARLGCIPLSVLKLSRGALSRSMFRLQAEKELGSVVGVPTATELEQMSPAQRAKNTELASLGRMASGPDRIAKGPGGARVQVSIMPAELVAFVLNYYGKPGDVYVDPFMGQGIQMQTAKRLGWHYYGYDLCAEYFRYIDAVRAKLDDGTTTISITNGDSRSMTAIPDAVGDVCFTSPPYWDIEWYGPEPEQLGIGKSYEQFIEGMHAVALELRRKMKPDAYAVINVNDFRRHGKFYPYHAHTIDLFERAGWRTHDTWIIEGLVGGLPRAYAVDHNRNRIAPKVHEYALVFRA